MRADLLGETILLDNFEVNVARQLTEGLLNSIKANSVKNGNPSLYFTALVVLHNYTGDILRAMSPEVVEKLFKTDKKDTGDSVQPSKN